MPEDVEPGRLRISQERSAEINFRHQRPRGRGASTRWSLTPDFGKAQLPSLKAATKTGVKVVAWAADPGGKPGEDYIAYVDWDSRSAPSVRWAEWTAGAIGGKGNASCSWADPRATLSAPILSRASKRLMAKYPGITMLTDYDDWPDPHELGRRAPPRRPLTRTPGDHHQVDAIINDGDGFTGLGVLRAYEAANKPLVPIWTLAARNGEFGCGIPSQARSPAGMKLEIRNLADSNLDGPGGRRARRSRPHRASRTMSRIFISFRSMKTPWPASLRNAHSAQAARRLHLQSLLTPQQLEAFGKTE